MIKNILPISKSDIKILSKEKAQQLLDEGREAMRSFRKPKEPGDYNIELDWGKLRGKKLERTCSVCSSQLENLYELVNSRPDFTGPGNSQWEFRGTRCAKCGLKYDLLGID